MPTGNPSEPRPSFPIRLLSDYTMRFRPEHSVSYRQLRVLTRETSLAERFSRAIFCARFVKRRSLGVRVPGSFRATEAANEGARPRIRRRLRLRRGRGDRRLLSWRWSRCRWPGRGCRNRRGRQSARRGARRDSRFRSHFHLALVVRAFIDHETLGHHLAANPPARHYLKPAPAIHFTGKFSGDRDVFRFDARVDVRTLGDKKRAAAIDGAL